MMSALGVEQGRSYGPRICSCFIQSFVQMLLNKSIKKLGFVKMYAKYVLNVISIHTIKDKE